MVRETLLICFVTMIVLLVAALVFLVISAKIKNDDTQKTRATAYKTIAVILLIVALGISIYARHTKYEYDRKFQNFVNKTVEEYRENGYKNNFIHRCPRCGAYVSSFSTHSCND